MSDTFGRILRHPVVAFCLVPVLLAVLYGLYTRTRERIHSSPDVPPENWAGREVIYRPRIRNVAYVFLGLACIGTVLALSSLFHQTLGALALTMALLVGAFVLIKAWVGFRGPLFTISDSGIDCAVYGMIPWTDVEAIRMSQDVPGYRGQSFLFVRVADVRKYPRKLTFIQFFIYGGFLGRSDPPTNEIVYELDGLNRRPPYIFGAMERLYQRALERAGKSPKRPAAHTARDPGSETVFGSNDRNVDRAPHRRTTLAQIRKDVGTFLANKKNQKQLVLTVIFIVIYIIYLVLPWVL